MTSGAEDLFPSGGVEGYRGKRVAVTGASGLIGSYVVKVLKESGAWVRGITHKRRTTAFAALADELVYANLMSQDHTYVFDGCEIVISCAGITGGVGLPGIDPVSYVGQATVMVLNTLQACLEAKVKRFGYLSSTTVYAPSEKAVEEDDVNHSDELYPLYAGIGHSKRFLEKMCAYYHRTMGLGTAIVRPAGAYGRFDNFDETTSHVLPGMVTRALRGEKVFEVWGDGQDVRDFIHAQDVARCLLLATEKYPNATPFNACSGVGVSTGDLAKLVLDAVGSEAKISLQPTKPTALRTRLVSPARAIAKLGFAAQIGLSEGIRDVVNWRSPL